MPDEGAIGSDKNRCRKWEVTALDKAWKCFSRNPVQMNDLNGVSSKQAKLKFSPEGQG